jgi:hypothetical protein
VEAGIGIGVGVGVGAGKADSAGDGADDAVTAERGAAGETPTPITMTARLSAPKARRIRGGNRLGDDGSMLIG